MLLEDEAGFERAARRARSGDPLEAPPLLGRETSGQVQLQCHATRGAVRVVVRVHRELADVPASLARVHGDSGGRARGERRRQKLMRRGPVVGAAQAFGLVGDKHVPVVDIDLVLERVAMAARCGGHAHNGLIVALDRLTRIRCQYASSSG